MKRPAFFFVFALFTLSLFAQETIPDKQFMLGCTNVGSSEQVTHYINAAGEVWQYRSGNFIYGGVYSNSLVTVGNANFQSADWPGFNFNWLFGEPYWSLGLYKVTNSKQPSKYFYLDARDSFFGSATSQDFYIYFDHTDGEYKKHRPTQPFIQINNGDVIRIWDIFGWDPTTNGLQNYWSNVLVLVNDGNNHPRLIWGPYPNKDFVVSYYKIYKKKGLQNFALYTTTTNAEYIDLQETLLVGPPVANETTAKYKVTAVGYLTETLNETSASNVVEARVAGDPSQKIGHNHNTSIKEFTLDQNYPNPFNPATVISYSVAENSFISLKVYDVLGNEITELVNEVKEPGNYSISFNASALPSGIYFYTVIANGYTLTKKMLLAK